MTSPSLFAPTEAPPPGTFEAIFQALAASSEPITGPLQVRLLVIPIHDDAGRVAGGLWGCTCLGWLHVQMLFVPEPLRCHGVGAALMAAAEAEARARGCVGVHLDALSDEAAEFYRRIGFTSFGALDDFPPGNRRIYFSKHFGGPAPA